MINWTSFAQNSSVVLSLPALNSGAHFSALLINILCGCLFLQNGALWSVLKTFSGRYFFSSKIFLLVCGHLLSASWSVESVCPVILTFFKQNLFLKLSNYPLLALNYPVLDHSPSFCFKLLYNDFTCFWIALVYVYTFLIAIQPPQKTKFSIQHKKVFCKKYKVFTPAGIAAATASWISFSFFTTVLTLNLFTLKWQAITAANLNS